MYLIELNEIDVECAVSDLEYFTASEDEYFSAEDSGSRHSMDSASRYSMDSGLRYSSVSNATLRRKHLYKMTDTDIRSKWSFDESEPRGKYKLRNHIPVDASGMRNYYIWRRAVLSGLHPRDAAHIMGSQFCFKQVKQKKNIQLFSIRLNSEHRVYFIIKVKECIVKILNIGGHSFR